MSSDKTPIEIEYYSDVLCIWAYVGCRRISELAERFGTGVHIRTRFCSVFSDVPGKIAAGWSERGGYGGYGNHVRHVAKDFAHVNVAAAAWDDVRPLSSAPAHLMLKAVQILQGDATAIPYAERADTRMAWALRKAFFADGRDISAPDVLDEIAAEQGLDPQALGATHVQAQAVAALAQDLDAARKSNVEGSPTLILNSGRQRLYGNVGYRLIEANVEELLRSPAADEVSWC